MTSAPDRVEVRVAGVLVRDHRVLLVKHRKPSTSYWVVPGGRVEFGETLDGALRREFCEELSMEVGVGNFIFVNDVVPDSVRRHVVSLYFSVCSDNDIAGENLNGVEDARFFSADELAGIDLRPPLQKVLSKVVRCETNYPVYLGNLWC